MRNVKMSDIAKAAGVSHATVARVLHKNGYVSEENRQNIERLIHEMGYVPNKMAQGLKNAQSKIIGHVMLFNPNMLFAKISYAVNRAAAERGFHVLTVTSHPNLDEEEAQIDELIGRRVEGVIITSDAFISRELVQKLVGLRIPVVMIERTLDLAQVDCIRVDDWQGAYSAVSHLTGLRHRRIGLIGMRPILPIHDVEQLRYQGYADAIQAAGLPVDEALVCLMDEYSPSAGYQAAEALMRLPEPPTAVFATSDLYACGVLQYLHHCGKKVPEDLSLVGYDDTLATLLAPPISSVGLLNEKIGEQALELLTRRMADGQAPAQSIPIETVFIERGSVRTA
jgi:DNA-binding LacI/PurR family transcriptional regulator